MKLYETAVRKPISTALIYIGVVIIGTMFFFQLPIDLFPEIESNMLTVITTYNGAGAEDVETNITRPLEDVLNSTENIKNISSRSSDNLSIILLEFNYGTNLDNSVNDVRDKLDIIKKFLPNGSEEPVIMKFSTDMIPVLVISATADQSSNALYKILDNAVANPLNRIPGVGTVSVSGAPEREVQVNVIPEKLEAYNIPLELLAQKIAQENVNVPAGSFDIGSQTYLLRLEGEFNESREINNIVLGNFRGQVVYLRDVATVNDTIESRVQESFTNGKKSATIIVQKQSGANSVQISKKVKETLPLLQKNLPPDVELMIVNDTSENIVTSINNLAETILIAFVIVALIVLFFLGRWRASIIIIVTIPVSLISAFIYLRVTGNTINIITLSALSIAIGLVVDDAIVVLENITRHIERGSRPDQASVYATEEVSLSVIASTLTIVAVFLPMTMIGGFAGILFKQLAWMVIIIITISLLASLSLTPMMSSKMLRAERFRGLTSRFDRGYAKTIKPLLDGFDNAYGRFLRVVTNHKWKTLLIMVVFITIVLVFSLSKLKTEFMPSSDNNYIEAVVELPTGTRAEITKETCFKINEIIKEKYPEIQIVASSYGQASDKNTFAAMQKNGTNIITYRMRLIEQKYRDKTIYDIGNEIREDLSNMPEIAKYQVVPGGDSHSGMGAGIVNVEILGYDLKTTDRIANELKTELSKVEGLVDVYISRQDYRQEYQVEFDREKLAVNGFTMNEAASAIKNRINGLVMSRYREDGDEYDIVVRYDEKYRQSLQDIENIVLYNSAGNSIRVKELGTVVEKSSLPQIERKNRERIVTVSGSIHKRALSDIIEDVNAVIEKTDIPPEIGTKIGGSFEYQQEAFADLTVLLIIATLLVYIILASQFESLSYPFIIITTVPIAFVGSLLSLVITNTPLGMMAFVGIIILVGIIVKNGIVLIDYINLNRERGESIINAVVNGGKSRLRPVLMTSLTTILGMLPLAVGTGQGSELWQSLGITVMGGMTFATLLTLIIVPALYTIFGYNIMKRRRKKLLKKLNS